MYEIEQKGKRYAVVTRRTGETHSEHDTLGDAKQAMRDRFSTHDANKKKRARPDVVKPKAAPSDEMPEG